jgi:fatty-acyl-CoA synthase
MIVEKNVGVSENMALSIARGPSLESEPGLGSSTLAGFLREITATYTDREAMTFRGGGGEVVRLTYRDMWQQAMRIARALIACGVGKDTRVGLLATNRPEWVVAMFGITLTGGTCVALSSFATVSELEQQLRLADVSVLILRAIGGKP